MRSVLSAFLLWCLNLPGPVPFPLSPFLHHLRWAPATGVGPWLLLISRLVLSPATCGSPFSLFSFPLPSPTCLHSPSPVQGPCATDAASPAQAPASVMDASADTSGDTLYMPTQPPAPSCPYNTIVAEYNAGTIPDQQPTMNNTEIRKILKFGRPTENNNGGHIWFGPEGYLYYASGMPTLDTLPKEQYGTVQSARYVLSAYRTQLFV